jgi:hypothetical protein
MIWGAAYEVDHGLLLDDALDSRHSFLVLVGPFNGDVNPNLIAHC